MALDALGPSKGNGTRIGQWNRNDGEWQQWRFLPSGDGYYRLQNRYSGKVIAVSGKSTADGADIVQWTDNNGADQQFRLADFAGGRLRLLNRLSNKAIEVWEWSTEDGARLSQFTDLDGENQQWSLVPVGTVASAYPMPGAVSGDTAVHDPEIVKRPERGYLLGGTGEGIQLKTSSDRTRWTDQGAAFPNGTPWADAYTGGDRNLWAPEIIHVNGQYYMWYSTSSFGSNRSAIFLATSPTGASGGWTHRGLVVESTTSSNFNAIDPAVTVGADGRWWMSFGSFWSGIKMIELDPSSGVRTGSALHSIAGRGGGAIEAPNTHYRDGYYYLYVSFDVCCRGADSTYRTMVGRSASITGPYVDRAGVPMAQGGGTQILAGHDGVFGPGHESVFSDVDSDVLANHYYTASGAAFLGTNLLGYDAEGWPYVH